MNTDLVLSLGSAHIPLSEKECSRIGFGRKDTADKEKCRSSHWAVTEIRKTYGNCY